MSSLQGTFPEVRVMDCTVFVGLCSDLQLLNSWRMEPTVEEGTHVLCLPNQHDLPGDTDRRQPGIVS